VRVKICGFTDPGDLRAVAGLGLDAIGLNFCAASPRRVDPDRAERILEACPAGTLAVGVFADTPAAHVAELAVRLGLDAVQLHGDEPPDHVRRLHAAGLRVIKAFRLGEPEHLAAMERWLESARDAESRPGAVLIDAAVPGQLGGTGRAVPDPVFDLIAARLTRWDVLLPAWRDLAWILAGGLNPDNVAERAARCPLPLAMVDAASGVESSPGRKDHARVAAFVAAARDRLDPALAAV
jgi:phosphoribosylanthranilate isomerase